MRGSSNCKVALYVLRNCLETEQEHHEPCTPDFSTNHAISQGDPAVLLYPMSNMRFTYTVFRALHDVSSIQGKRHEGLTGVWVEGQKVAAIGIRARRWVTYHGLALNICPDLGHYSHIIPCGIADKPVTSVSRLLEGQRAPTLSSDMLLKEYSVALFSAFQEVFNCSMVGKGVRL